MAIDTREKRAAITGVGRPWLRDKLPVAAKNQEWRIASGNAYGGNALGAVGGAGGEWEMIPPWKKHRRLAMHRI